MKTFQLSGGLGNQMFIYAFSLNFEKHKLKYEISSYQREKIHNGLEIEKIFPKINLNKITAKHSIPARILSRITAHKKFNEANSFDYTPINHLLKYNKFIGWFQNPKYLTNIENKIKDKFTFPEIKEQKNLKALKKIQDTNSVSIHIRQGDYLSNRFKEEYLNLLQTKYYETAINLIKNKTKNPTFFIFSDNINTTKNKLKKIKNLHFIDWNTDKNSFRDMQLMSLCKHNIIANSSFSFWAANLNQNPNKIIIAPSKYRRQERKPFEYDAKWITINPTQNLL